MPHCGNEKKRKQTFIPTHDLLLTFSQHSVPIDEVQKVSKKWGSTKSVHRPFADRNYTFIRYEKKIEMISALKNFYDNINAMMPQEWRHANLEEFPSNSHFENIIREVPSEISDKEWYDCLVNYAAVRVTARLPEVRPGFHDMFISMENQSADDIFKALLATAEKYGSTMVDILLGNFIPPPSFRSNIANPSTKQKPKNTTRLYDLRDFCADQENESPEDWPHAQSDTLPAPKTGRAVLSENFQTLIKLPGVLNLNFASLSGDSVDGLNSTKLPKPSNSTIHIKSQKPSPEKPTDVPRKDPSDIWFSCGEEAEVFERTEGAEKPSISPPVAESPAVSESKSRDSSNSDWINHQGSPPPEPIWGFGGRPEEKQEVHSSRNASYLSDFEMRLVPEPDVNQYLESSSSSSARTSPGQLKPGQ